VVAGAAFLTLLVGSGLRSLPTVMITPLGDDFGRRVDQISLAIAVNLVLFGLMAPLLARLMERVFDIVGTARRPGVPAAEPV
jgi:hypothetical protein